MKESVQNKINQMLQLAKNRPTIEQTKNKAFHRTDDSLSKAIRNPREAKIFLAELEAVIKAADQ